MRLFTTGELTSLEVKAIRELLDVAFAPDEDERFTEDDWQRAIGGMHFVLDVDGAVAAHASVVARVLHVRGAPLRTGYVEAVATAPSRQRRGLGTSVMRNVGKYISERFELGALGTGSHGFYERLGWVAWAGPSSVRMPDGERRTTTPTSWCSARILAPTRHHRTDQLRLASGRRLVGGSRE